MQKQKLRQTRDYYEEFPFIEGGEERIRWWQEYLRPFLPDDLIKGRLIGDIGSGIGEISNGLARRGARMVCLDITLAALRRCKEINPDAQFFHGNALNLPFADGAFDHMISIGVLMVTPDCRKGIQEVVRVTAPGGTIVLFIYNYWSYLNLVYHLFKPITKVIPLKSIPESLVCLMQPFVKSHLRNKLDTHQLRRLLGDKLWTPNATFHTLRQIKKWGEEEGLTFVQWKRFYHAYANVIAFKKQGTSKSTPIEDLRLRCLNCGNSPLSQTEEKYFCGQCQETYGKEDGINLFLT